MYFVATDPEKKWNYFTSTPTHLVVDYIGIRKLWTTPCGSIGRRKSRDRIQRGISAGVLESITTDLLRRLTIDQRLNAEGMLEDGLNLADGSAANFDIAR